VAGGEIPERRGFKKIVWLLFDQAKSSINYNKRKQNENENVKENEYDGDTSLVEPLRGRRENRRTAEVRIRKISIGLQHAKSACISERSEAFSQCCQREPPRLGSAETPLLSLRAGGENPERLRPDSEASLVGTT
jgi:hypothetical protein